MTNGIARVQASAADRTTDATGTAGRTGAAPSRRAVTRGAAWAVPVVAVGAAAPLAAASPCGASSYVIDWGVTSWTRSSDGRSGRATTLDPAGPNPPIVMSVTSAYVGSMQAGTEKSGNNSLVVNSGTVGGSFIGGLGIQQSITGSYNVTPPQRSARGIYTFSFTANGQPVAVTNLRFTITDIDSTAGDFWDGVEIDGTRTATPASTITGRGDSTQSWYLRDSDTALADSTSSAGNVGIVFTVPTSSFTLTYWNGVTSFSGVDRSQGIFVTDMSFSYASNLC